MKTRPTNVGVLFPSRRVRSWCATMFQGTKVATTRWTRNEIADGGAVAVAVAVAVAAADIDVRCTWFALLLLIFPFVAFLVRWANQN